MRYFLILFAGLLLLSCSKDNRLRFEQRLEAKIQVPTGLNLIETHVFVLEDIPSFYAENLAFNQLASSDIDEVLAARGHFEFPFSGTDFNFLERVSIRIYPQNRPNEYVEMYYLDQVPFNAEAPLRLFNGIANLNTIMQNEVFDMEIRLKFRTFTPPNLRLRLDYGYHLYKNN